MEQRILNAVGAHRNVEKRFLHSIARQYAEPLVRYLQAVIGVNDVVVAGSYRRGRETVGDLDIVVTARENSAVIQKFVAYDEVTETVSRGTTRAAVFLRSGMQVDLRVVEQQSFGAALHYFTGSNTSSTAFQVLQLPFNSIPFFGAGKRIFFPGDYRPLLG